MWTLLLLACSSSVDAPPKPPPPAPVVQAPSQPAPPPRGPGQQTIDPNAACARMYTSDDANAIFIWGRKLTFTPCSFEEVNVQGNRIEVVVEDAAERELSLQIVPKECPTLVGKKAEAAGPALFDIPNEVRSTCPAGVDAMLNSARAGTMPGSSVAPAARKEAGTDK